MAEINSPQRALLSLALIKPWERLNELAAQEQIQPVITQVHREMVADQRRKETEVNAMQFNRLDAAHPHDKSVVVCKMYHRQQP